VIKVDEPRLVVEAHISDKSFNESLNYPSDGRYFTAKLTTTSDVTNVRATPVQFATVQLLNDHGDVWEYIESAPGIYTLLDDGFSAEAGVQYKLTIKLSDERVVESEWESLPDTPPPAMGQISFQEEDIQKYKIELNETVIVTAKALRTKIEIPQNTSGEALHYRWSFAPHWVYKAPLAPSSASPGYICWIKDPNYIRNYALLQLNNSGNFSKDLFLIETVRNERIFEKFSALIVQHTMREDYYHFWKEMQEQNESGAIVTNPPFNLSSNFHALTDDKPIVGYFGVVQEQATRWYFDKTELSYYVDNTLMKDCTVPFQDPAPECFDCREYSFGVATNVKPSWWIY
jgi:hypothetical protein